MLLRGDADIIYLGLICNREKKGAWAMDIKVGDILTMKKSHPCGGNTFTVLRVGMDFKLRCNTCGHEIMGRRSKIEKNIKAVSSTDR